MANSTQTGGGDLAGRDRVRSSNPPSMPPRGQRMRAGLAVVAITLVLLLCACGTLATCAVVSWEREPAPQEAVPIALAGDAA